MNPHATTGLSDACSDLEQLESQGTDLSMGKLSALKIFTQEPKQTVGKGVEKKAKLIGQKPVTA